VAGESTPEPRRTLKGEKMRKADRKVPDRAVGVKGERQQTNKKTKKIDLDT
jgi:hypothetical protein